MDEDFRRELRKIHKKKFIISLIDALIMANFILGVGYLVTFYVKPGLLQMLMGIGAGIVAKQIYKHLKRTRENN